MAKFDYERFYSKYVKRAVLEKASSKKLNKLDGSFFANFFLLPTLWLSYFTFTDLTNLGFTLFTVTFSIFIFFFLLDINSTIKLIKRSKSIGIFRDINYVYKKLIYKAFLVFYIAFAEIFVNLTYVLFDYQLFMLGKIIVLVFLYIPMEAYLYDFICKEFFIGLGDWCKIREEQDKIKEEEIRNSLPLAFRDESNCEDEKN